MDSNKPAEHVKETYLLLDTVRDYFDKKYGHYGISLSTDGTVNFKETEYVGTWSIYQGTMTVSFDITDEMKEYALD